MLSICLAALGWGSKKEHEGVSSDDEALMSHVMTHTGSGKLVGFVPPTNTSGDKSQRGGQIPLALKQAAYYPIGQVMRAHRLRAIFEELLELSSHVRVSAE